MRFYVGNYTRMGGPGVCECALEAGVLRLVQNADTYLENPTWLTLSKDGRTLFATASTHAEGEECASVAAFDVSEGRLHMTSIRSTGGLSACHLAESPDGRFLYCANYADGKLTVFPIEDGKLLPRIQLIQHEGHGLDPVRQEGPHAHCVCIDEKDGLLYAADLGMDAVMVYRRNEKDGLLTPEERLDMPEGAGPRHLVIDGDMMYVAHELAGKVSVLRRSSLGWSMEQTLSTLPEDYGEEGAVAAIRHVGHFIYVSNRETDSIAEFEIRLGGTLRLNRVIPTFGAFPRDFIPFEEGIFLVACQNSGEIRLIQANPTDRNTLSYYHPTDFLEKCGVERLMMPFGAVAELADPLELAGAVCICPAE